MPVILMAQDQEKWLRGSIDDVMQLQSGYPSQLMSLE
ncbi:MULTISPECIES: SOS response-associated peptidase [unclassified Sphingomonas]|jgi:putative SOS response-associated peptidase YedK|nr:MULTISPECIES: SOS response-associated peptidase [unclassified Sphingomonas]